MTVDPRAVARVAAARQAIAQDPARVRAALEAWREARAEDDRRAAKLVVPDLTLDFLSATPPSSFADLSDAPGMGDARMARYGTELLAIAKRAREVAEAAERAKVAESARVRRLRAAGRGKASG